jgi:hypothetical protein
VSVTAAPTGKDTLGAGESFVVTVDGTAESEGELVIPVLIDSADGGEERLEIDVRVVNKSQLITNVSELLNNLLTQIENLDLGRGRQQALLSSINAASDSADRSQQQLKKSNIIASNNSLTTAQNQLGAFLNKLAAGGGGNSKGNSGNGGGSGGNNKGNGGNGGNGSNGGNSGPSGPLSETERVTLERSAENAIDLLAAAKEAAK